MMINEAPGPPYAVFHALGAFPLWNLSKQFDLLDLLSTVIYRIGYGNFYSCMHITKQIL